MRKLLWLAAAVVAVAPARADDPKPEPVVTARVRSLIDLTGYAEYLGGLVGQGDPAKQAAQLVRGLADPDKGIEGMDPARPIGLYGVMTPDVVNSYAVAVVPVADETALMELLTGRLNLEPKKGQGGVYQMTVPNVPVPVFFRFANKSAYVTVRSPDPLADDKLMAPADLFAGKEEAAVAVRLFPGRVPEPLRRVFLGQLELQLAQQAKARAAEPKPMDPAASTRDMGRVAGERGGFAVLKTLVLDADELTARVEVTPDRDDLAAEVVVTPKAGSGLAKLFRVEAGLTGAAGRVSPPDSAAVAGVRFDIPKEAQADLDAVVDAVTADIIQRETPAKQNTIRKILAAVAPTLKSRVVDVGLVVTGDAPGTFRATAEVRVTDGDGIAKAVKEAEAADPSAGAITTFDAETVNGVALHKIEFKNAADLAKSFGSPVVRLGTSADRLLLSVGPDDKLLKQVIRAERGVVPVVRFDLAAAPLRKVANDLAVGPVGGVIDGKDAVRLAVTGGDVLTARLTAKGWVVRLATALERVNKEK